MKHHLINIALQILIIFCAGVVLHLAWNEVVPKLFHYKEITLIQSLWISAVVRLLTIK